MIYLSSFQFERLEAYEMVAICKGNAKDGKKCQLTVSIIRQCEFVWYEYETLVWDDKTENYKTESYNTY